MDGHLPVVHRSDPGNPTKLRPVAPNIWATRDEPLGGPANTCGFLIQRPAGNVFIYSCSAIIDYFDDIDRLGGVTTILLNHRDEATKHVTTLSDHYRAPVRMHPAEIEPSTEKGVRNIMALEAQETLGNDLSVLRTPGHTPGTTSYLYANPGDALTYAFTGDTFTNFTIDRFGSVLDFHPYEGNGADMRQTLERLRETQTDVIVPGLANGTINAYTWNTAQRRQLLNHCEAQLPVTACGGPRRDGTAKAE